MWAHSTPKHPCAAPCEGRSRFNRGHTTMRSTRRDSTDRSSSANVQSPFPVPGLPSLSESTRPVRALYEGYTPGQWSPVGTPQNALPWSLWGALLLTRVVLKCFTTDHCTPHDTHPIPVAKQGPHSGTPPQSDEFCSAHTHTHTARARTQHAKPPQTQLQVDRLPRVSKFCCSAKAFTRDGKSKTKPMAGTWRQ